MPAFLKPELHGVAHPGAPVAALRDCESYCPVQDVATLDLTADAIGVEVDN